MADPPNTDRSNVPAWNVAAMIDFEDLLRADDGAADETLVARDRAIAAEQIVPVLGENFGDRADSATRRRAFRVWLGARSDAESARREGAGLSAGEAFVHARRLTGAALAVGALISGASVAAGLLNREWRYFNVLLFLAVTLLPQLALLAMLLAGAVFRKALGKSATLGLAQTFARAAVDWLAEKASSAAPATPR